MFRVAQSIFGSQRGLLGSNSEGRGAPIWYSLIDRGEEQETVCVSGIVKRATEKRRGGVHGGRKGAVFEGGRSVVEWRHRARKLHCVLGD